MKWYHGVTRYQWLVVLIASAGWVFDAFEGQLFNVTRNQILADILRVAPGDPAMRFWGDVFLGVFLVGGTFGENGSGPFRIPICVRVWACGLQIFKSQHVSPMH